MTFPSGSAKLPFKGRKRFSPGISALSVVGWIPHRRRGDMGRRKGCEFAIANDEG